MSRKLYPRYLQFLEGFTPICPVCQSACHRQAWYGRKAVDGTGTVTITILRVKCITCRRTHAVLPDFLRPFGRYVQPVRESVGPCFVAKVPVEKTVFHGQVVETSRRWLSRLREGLDAAAGALTSVLANFGRGVPAMRGSPFCRLHRLCRELSETIGATWHSCFFGLVNTFLSLGGMGTWL